MDNRKYKGKELKADDWEWDYNAYVSLNKK